MGVERLSADEARRIALGAQGFGGARAVSPSGPAALARMIERLQMLQIDSVNVLSRAHYLPLYADSVYFRKAASHAS